jgi:hypothetical protein
VSVKKKWKADVAAARKNWQAQTIMRTGFASSRRGLTACFLAVALCVVSAWPAQAITSNNHFAPAVRVTSETAYTGVFESGAQAYTGLFVADNPVNNVDPTGLFSQGFGYQAHAAIESAYQAEHPGAIVGPTTGVLGTRLKPDIFDGISHTYMEIKPLSLSGVAKGIVQIGAYDLAFTALGVGYARGTWPAGVRGTYVGMDPIAYFNVQGIIFYTDAVDNAEDLVGITSFALARQFVIQNSALLARSFSGSLARIPGLAVSGAATDNTRLQGMEGIATLDSLIGGF